MSLYYFITRYLYRMQHIMVHYDGGIPIRNELCTFIIDENKYKYLMDKTVTRICTTDMSGTIAIYVK